MTAPYLFCGGTGTSGVTSASKAVTTATAAGDTLAVAVCDTGSGSPSVSSITDSAGNVYTLGKSFTTTTPYVFVYVSPGVTGGSGGGATAALTTSGTVMVTFSSATTGGWELIGVDCLATGAVDVAAVANGTSAAPSVSGTPAHSGETALAVFAWQSGGGAGTLSGAFTSLGQEHAGSNPYLTCAYAANPTSGSALTAAATVTSAVWRAILLTFTPSVSPGGSSGGSGPSALWYMTNVTYISGMDAGDTTSTHALFGKAASFGLSNSQATPGIPSGYSCTPCLKYISYGQFWADVTGTSRTISGVTYTPVAIAGAYQWLMYDNEAWNPNPPSPYVSAAAQAEIDDPWTYMGSFVSLAHAHGYKVILAPALDLGNDATSVNPKMSGETNQAWYTRTNIAGTAAATGADVIHIQAQSLTTTGSYASFVTSCVSQVTAGATSSAQQVSTGISTSYGTPAQMLAAVQSVSGISGVWLNATNATISTAVTFEQDAVTAGPVGISPGLTSTFMAPGTGGNLTWTQTRYNQELYGAGTGMWQAGITSVILQWAADVYANTAYYPSPTIPHSSSQMVPALYTAAAQPTPAMGVWLGLGITTANGTSDYYNFYENCVNSTTYNAATLLPFTEKVADELVTLYGTAISGFYICQEVDGNYPAGSAQAGNAATYYQALVSYIHANHPGIPVLVSPDFSDLKLTPAQYAAMITQLFVPSTASARPDIIALQSGAGDASAGSNDVTPAQMASYFSAVSSALSGTGVGLWENCDLYTGTGGPINVSDLAASMTAVAPYVTSYTGFSYTSQMSPLTLGTASVYNAYIAALAAPTSGGGGGGGAGATSQIVNQWKGTFAQPAVFGNMPPALESVVVPLAPGASNAGSGTGISTPGNWLVAIIGWNQADALPSVDFGDGDDIHSYWRPGGVSGPAGRTGTSVWYTPNIARQVNDVYVAPNGACAGVSVLVLEVSGIGPWDTITTVFTNFANAATSLNLALPAPPASACLIAAVTGDSAAASQAFAPSGWTALSTVTASNGVNHVSDVVLTSAMLPSATGAASVTATASTTDLSGVIIGVLSNAPSPIPVGWNPAWPYLWFEMAPGGGFETPPDQLQWIRLANRLWSWHEATGLQYQLAQLMSTDGDIEVDNFDGSLSPSNPGGLWYSNALNVNMSFNAPYPYMGVAPWTGVGGAALSQSSAHAFASAPNAVATYSCEVTPNGTTATPGAQSEMDPVTAGQVYSASAWFYSPAGWSTGAQAAIKWFNSSGTLISTSAVTATAIPAATWTQVTQLGVTAPSGATHASIVPQFAGTPSASAPYWLAEAALVAGSAAPVTGRVTTGTPVRLRCALGTIGGTVVNRWYVLSRNALSWPEKRNKALRNFVAATFTDLWGVATKSSPTPYRGEVQQDQPYAWWPLDDQAGLGGVLPTSMRNAAIGNTNALNIILSPLGGVPQDNYTINGHNCGADAGGSSLDKDMAQYAVAALGGWMYGDPQSGLESAQSGNAVTAQPGSAAWQQTQVSGNTGSYGWFLSCYDPDFPPLSSGVTHEGWFNWAFWGSGTQGTYPTGVGSTTAGASQAQQPYCPLTLWAITTGSAPVAVLQLDLSGHLQLLTYSGTTSTSHPVYTGSDLRSATWHSYVVKLTQTTWEVLVDGGVTAAVSGTATGMTSSWQWLILNGDMGTAGGSSTSDIAHGGNVAISHFAIYGYQLPDYRAMAHFNAAIMGFGQLPPPTQVQAGFETSCFAQDGSAQIGQLYAGEYGGITPTIPRSTNPATAVMSVVVSAAAGAYTSGPSAWTTTSTWSTWLACWVSWTGFAPGFNVYTSNQLGNETHAAVVCGPGDLFVSGYGSGATGVGFFQVGDGTGATPPVIASSVGDTVGQRLERLLGYGNVTAPRRCIDPAPLLVQAALDIGGSQVGSNVNNIVQSDNGLFYVDNQGNLFYRQRPHLNSDPIAWHIGMNVAAGMIPFEGDILFQNDPVRVVDDVEVTPYAPDGSTPPVLTPTSAVAVNAAQQQYGDRQQQVTSYLQDPAKQQIQANWLFSAFSTLQRRIDQMTISAAGHPAAWPFVLGACIGDVIQVYDAPFGAPATVGTYRITHLERSIGYGANGGSVAGSAVVVADPVPPGGFWS